jgi:hypothetical protein
VQLGLDPPRVGDRPHQLVADGQKMPPGEP